MEKWKTPILQQIRTVTLIHTTHLEVMWRYFIQEKTPGPEVIKLLSYSSQLSTKFQLLMKTTILTNKEIPGLSLSDVVFILLINVKMPTIVGILTFMSRSNFVLSWVEHGKSFITSGPDFLIYFICYKLNDLCSGLFIKFCIESLIWCFNRLA